MDAVGCQLDCQWENKAASCERVRRLLDAAPPAAGSLIVLPEMFATGFSMNVRAIAETPGGESHRLLAELAVRWKSTLLGGVVSSGRDGLGRNEAVIVGPDGAEAARYSKMHPFPPAGEDRFFEAGEGPTLLEWNGFLIAPFICYDLRFPEVFRQAALAGADLFVAIASWPSRRESHWTSLLAARAIENQAYVVGVNRCGRDPEHAYSGRTQIIGPRGDILADAGNGEGTVRAALDRDDLTRYRAEFPVLTHIRGDVLGL